MNTKIEATPIIRQEGDKYFLTVNSFRVQLRTLHDVVQCCTPPTGPLPEFSVSVERVRCGHVNGYGVQCIKDHGHATKKHQYVHKRYPNRGKAKHGHQASNATLVKSDPAKLTRKEAQTLAEVPVKKSEKANGALNGNLYDARHERRDKGLCFWCDKKPVKGKKLCAGHLAGARARAAKFHKQRREKQAVFNSATEVATSA